jgi:hypothetical protein
MTTAIEVVGSSSDGRLFSKTNSHFSVARDAVNADYLAAGLTALRVGLGYDMAGDKYRFYRCYLYFDTSSIPDGATILSATLSLYLKDDLTILPSGFAIVLGKDTGGTYPHDPLVLGDFDRTLYTGGGASTPWVYTGQSGYKTFTFTSLGKSSWINDQGTSKFVLMSSLDVGYTVPYDYMLADFYSQEAGSSYWPKLGLTYAKVATVVTNAATGITSSGATGDGQVTDDGDESIDEYGVIWNDDGSDPVSKALADNYATGSDIDGSGNFTAAITGCDAETAYYYRAYAIQDLAIDPDTVTFMGDAVQFTTTADSTILSVTTQAASDVSTTTATANGTLVEDAGGTVTERGFVYKLGGDPGTPADPTDADNYTEDGGTAEGAYTSDLTGLTATSTYFIRAYVTTSEDGTAYGGVELIRTGTEEVETLYSSTSDGFANRSSSPTYDTYLKIWEATTAGYVDGSSDTISVGDKFIVGIAIPRFLRRGFLYFDLSAIPAGAEVISAVLSLYLESDSSYGTYSGWGFVVQKAASWAYPSDPLVVGDYDKDHYSGNYGELLQADFSVGSYNDITLDADVLNLGGDTRLAIRTNRDIATWGPPTDTQRYAAFYSADKGTTYRPKLVITYADPQTPVFPKVNKGDAWVDPLNILVNIGDEWVAYEDLDVNLGDSWVEPI